jgi:hypothetical protein
MTVGELRQVVGVNEPKKIKLIDYFAFAFYAVIVLISASIFFFTVYALLKFNIEVV